MLYRYNPRFKYPLVKKLTIRIRIEIEPLKFGRLGLDKEMEEGSTLEDLLNKLAITLHEVIKHFYNLKDRKLSGAATTKLLSKQSE